MDSLTKTDRELRGPGFFEITLSVVLSIILGIVLACVYLVLKPVETVKEMPKEPVSGTVYYLEGSTDANKGRQWGRKRQMLTETSSADVSFSEEELNAWIASVMPQTTVKHPPATKPANQAKPDSTKDEAKGFSIIPDRLNFRIRNDVFQVGIPAMINIFGASIPMIVQARGHFSKGSDGFVFNADELYVGSLPTQSVPGLKNFFIRRAIAAQNIPDDMRTAWVKLTLLAVEGSVLHLSLP